MPLRGAENDVKLVILIVLLAVAQTLAFKLLLEDSDE
jgi:hypothetical protein